MLSSHEAHRHSSTRKLKVSLITISTSRYRKMIKNEKFVDEAGLLAKKMVTKAGHTVLSEKLVEDDSKLIRGELLNTIYENHVDAVILMGGTGLATQDVSVETVRPLFEKEMEGFGEIFRSVSYQKIGNAAYLTRATAGTIGGRAVYCLPGSPAAVETALTIILPELPHVVYIAGQ